MQSFRLLLIFGALQLNFNVFCTVNVIGHHHFFGGRLHKCQEGCLLLEEGINILDVTLAFAIFDMEKYFEALNTFGYKLHPSN